MSKEQPDSISEQNGVYRKEFEFFHPIGRVEVITGPMLCGKSEELIRRVRLAKIAVQSWLNNRIIPEGITKGEVVQVFAPDIDTRRGIGTINSESGLEEKAIPIKKASDIFSYISANTRVVALDEAQFLEDVDLIATCRRLAKVKHIRVIVAGLALNFRREPWGGVGALALEAEEALILKSICAKCGSPDAIFTQRIIEVAGENGRTIRKPADYDDPIVLVGSLSHYEARCRGCHELPRVASVDSIPIPLIDLGM